MQLSNDIIIKELMNSVEIMQEKLRAQQFEIANLKSTQKELKRQHEGLKEQLETANAETEWVDKRTFVNILNELGLMDAARSQSKTDTADDQRYLNRLMRDWCIFRTHEGTGDPPATKQVWKLSTKKLLFHRSRAVDQFRIFTKMRSRFDRTNQD